MRLSHRLREAAMPIWQQILRHPFVTGIGDGSLPADRFRFYIRQDYLFLIEYSRVLALAVVKTPRVETMRKFATLLSQTLNAEMEVHREFAAECGLSRDDLESTTPAPTTYAYTRHLLHVASSGDLADILTAVLPCQWGYSEIAQALARGRGPACGGRYHRWIEMYASEDFAALAGWLRESLDGLEARSHEERLVGIFRTSARYEYLFWEMAFGMEDWPV